MSKETIKEIGLDELAGKHFIVPDYQRGYRWEREEVTKLLEDIREFKSPLRNTNYCLQPLVVQAKTGKPNEFILIDGQQRLTTIKILTELAKEKNKTSKDIDIKDFSISYEARPGSENFLDKIAVNPADSSNPDFHYMSRAKIHIENYIKDNRLAIRDVYNDVLKKANFLWYEDNTMEAIKLFQKLNVGKVPLTNAELVKAILLNRRNYYTEIEKDEKGMESLLPLIEKEQRENAQAWDFIEQSLSNDAFWYFIADDKYKDASPRIEVILEAVAQDIKANKGLSFDVFEEEIKKHKDNEEERKKYVKELWRKIVVKHSLFYEWYENDKYYHMIGFLVRSGAKSIIEISKEVHGKRKSAMTKSLREAIEKSNCLKKYLANDLDYSKTSDKKELRNFFLLFNILTILQQLNPDEKTKHRENTLLRFPFDKYVDFKWDIEHIHAQNDSSAALSDEDENAIENLTLLDCFTNRAYQDNEFSSKQQFIRELLKTDRFIPLCTQNVFFKIYSTETPNTDAWEESEKKQYELLRAKRKDEIKTMEDLKRENSQWNELDRFLYGIEIKYIMKTIKGIK